MSMTPTCCGPQPPPYVTIISSYLVASSVLPAFEKSSTCRARHAFYRFHPRCFPWHMCHGTCAGTPSRRCSCCLVRVAPSHGLCQAPKHL